MRVDSPNRRSSSTAPAWAAALMVLALVSAATATAQQAADESPRPGGPPVTVWRGGGLSVELAPLLIAPAAAFFLNRGFAHDDAVELARTGCVFRSSIGHAETEPGAAPIEIDLRAWRVRSGGAWRSYKTKKRWLAGFERKGLSKQARIALRWALFPTRQTYRANDFNWGIHAFGLPPGSAFDLEVRWRYGGAEHSHVLTGLKCSDEGDAGVLR